MRQKKTEKNIFNSFFPLTGFAKWFLVLYGKQGFREYQILISRKNIREFVSDLTGLIKKEKPNLNIVSVKPFRGKQKFLQFCGDGLSIVLDFPNSSSTSQFLPKIDDLVMSYPALPNIIKDSRLPKHVVQKCYPQYDDFRTFLKKFDSDRIFKSHVSQKLDL